MSGSFICTSDNLHPGLGVDTRFNLTLRYDTQAIPEHQEPGIGAEYSAVALTGIIGPYHISVSSRLIIGTSIYYGFLIGQNHLTEVSLGSQKAQLFLQLRIPDPDGSHHIRTLPTLPAHFPPPNLRSLSDIYRPYPGICWPKTYLGNAFGDWDMIFRLAVNDNNPENSSWYRGYLDSLSATLDTAMVYPVGREDIRPTAAASSITQNGYQLTQDFNNTAGHTGVDLANGLEGGTVRAVFEGTVSRVRPDPIKGFGNHVRIRHDVPGLGVVYSQYAHLQDGSITITENQLVSTGQVIGRLDCSGNSKGTAICPSNNRHGPHLHFSIQRMDRSACGYLPDARCPNDKIVVDYVDPLEFIADRR